MSNAVFSVLMDDLPSHLDRGIHVFVYCDNMILIAPTMSRALRAQDALVRYLSGHRAGPFDVTSTVTTASGQFEHLGYSMSRKPRSEPEVGLSLSGWLKFGARLDAEPFDLDGMNRWLLTSYSQCSERIKGELVQRIIDEMTYRNQARNAA